MHMTGYFFACKGVNRKDQFPPVMQTILGSGGAIGIELTKALTDYTGEIRLVSRHPQKVNETDKLVAADLTNPSDVIRAVEGSSVAYLTVGLPYNLTTWKKQWPVVMRNVINACETHRTKLVFFDNIYCYDKDHLNGMTEETPVNPPSEKGKVRTHLINMLFDAIGNGKVKALIARSADFYGPSTNASLLTETVFKPLAAGKKANWVGNPETRHSFTYTPDAAKATALLGNTDDAYGQVWHLPTITNPPTGLEWIDAIAKELNKAPDFRIVSRSMVRFMGLFNRPMKEIVEMYYQLDRDYVFDSSKFQRRFAIEPTRVPDAIREIVQADYQTS